MNPNIELVDLIKAPAFGVNKVRKIALENLSESQFLEYSLSPNGKLLRILTLYPNVLNEFKPYRKFVEVKFDKNIPAVVKLFEDIENGVFLNMGELLADNLKADVVAIKEVELGKKLSYGTDPILINVNSNIKNNVSIRFSSIKNGKRQDHQALWALIDVATEVTGTIIIPKNLYKTFREFDTILATLLGTEVGRFNYREDPAETNADSIQVYISKDDLLYCGSLQVNLPQFGEEARIVPLHTGGEEVPPVDLNKDATYDLKISFNETNTDSNDDHAYYANPGDILYLHIRATGLVQPQPLNLVLTAADGPANISLEDDTVIVPATGLLTVPLMYDSAVADRSTTALAMKGVAIVGSSRSLGLMSTAVVPTFTASPAAKFIPVGVEFGVNVVQNTPNYTPRSVVWSSVPAGVTFQTVSPDKLAAMATLPNTLQPDDTVVISITVDGIKTDLETTTVVSAG